MDFGLWGLSLGLANLEELEGLFEQGAVAVKLFWGYALHRVTKQLIYNVSDEPPENVLPPAPRWWSGRILTPFRTAATTTARRAFAAAVEAARLVAARGRLRKTFRVVVFSCEE